MGPQSKQDEYRSISVSADKTLVYKCTAQRRQPQGSRHPSLVKGMDTYFLQYIATPGDLHCSLGQATGGAEGNTSPLLLLLALCIVLQSSPYRFVRCVRQLAPQCFPLLAVWPGVGFSCCKTPARGLGTTSHSSSSGSARLLCRTSQPPALLWCAAVPSGAPLRLPPPPPCQTLPLPPPPLVDVRGGCGRAAEGERAVRTAAGRAGSTALGMVRATYFQAGRSSRRRAPTPRWSASSARHSVCATACAACTTDRTDIASPTWSVP